MRDYYKILEVPPTATTAEIKRSYHRLARLHHPDLNKQAKDTLIKRLNEAYAVLSDPVKRAAYDAQRADEQQRAAARAMKGREVVGLSGRLHQGWAVFLKKAPPARTGFQHSPHPATKIVLVRKFRTGPRLRTASRQAV